MYWGSKYCAGCKYNRDCYMINCETFGYIFKSNTCIIVQKAFEEEYKKVNNKED